jgi:hypothetical protein
LTTIFWESEVEIGIYGVHPNILQGVGSDFVGKADSTSLLLQIDNGTAILR